jgi:TP901 family phage tail tape measure protein
MPGIRLNIDASQARQAERTAKGAFSGIGQSAKETENKVDRMGRALGMERYANALRGSASKVDRSLASMRRGVNNLIGKVVSLQGALVGLGGALVIRKTLISFSELEQGLIEVQKTTGMADAEIAQLKTQIHEIGQEVPVATTRLLEIAGAAGQLGVKGVKNVRLFTETLAKMEVASDIVGAEGAKALARLLNTAGESMDKVDELGSVIVALGNNAAASESEIVKMASEIGRATAAFEVSSDQVVAYGAALKSMGARAELSGSAIGRMMIMIEKASISGGEQLQKLANMAGMTANKFRSAFEKDAASALNALLRGMNRMVTDEGRKAVGLLGDLGLNSMEVVKGITPLISNIEELDNAFNIANDEMEDSNALTREAFEASKSFSSQMQMTWNAVDKVAAEVGKALAPAIVDMTKDFRDWVDENDKFIKQDIPNEIENMADRVLDLKDSMSDLVNSSEFQTFMDNWEMIAGAAIGYRLGGWKGAITMAAGADIFSRAKDIASETGQDATDPKVLAQVLGFTDSAASPSGRWQIDPRAEHPDADRLRRFRREQEKNQKLLDLYRNPDYGLDDLNPDKNGNSGNSGNGGNGGGGGESEKERLARINAEHEENLRLLDAISYKTALANQQETEKQKRLEEFEKKYSNAYQNMIEKHDTWVDGAKAGFDEYANSAMNTMQQVNNIVYSSFRSMEDSLVDFVMTGKFEWRDMVNSMLEDWTRLMVRQSVTGPLAKAGSSMLSSLFSSYMGGGTTSGGLSTSSNFISSSGGHLNAYASGGLINEPVFGMGQKTGENYLIGESGPEYVTPARQMQSQSPPPITVQVINKTGEKADAKQGQTKWDGEKWVMSIVLDAANRNKGGFGKNLSAALQKQG